jgi:hypothetical protein
MEAMQEHNGAAVGRADRKHRSAEPKCTPLT